MAQRQRGDVREKGLLLFIRCSVGLVFCTVVISQAAHSQSKGLPQCSPHSLKITFVFKKLRLSLGIITGAKGKRFRAVVFSHGNMNRVTAISGRVDTAQIFQRLNYKVLWATLILQVVAYPSSNRCNGLIYTSVISPSAYFGMFFRINPVPILVNFLFR